MLRRCQQHRATTIVLDLIVSEVNGKYAPVPGKIPGRPINLGGRDFVLAPLSLDQIRHFEPQAKELDKPNGTLAEQIEAVLPLILASLQRNYEDMTVDHLRPLIDVGNFAEAARAVVDVTGYRTAPPGESRPASP